MGERNVAPGNGMMESQKKRSRSVLQKTGEDPPRWAQLQYPGEKEKNRRGVGEGSSGNKKGGSSRLRCRDRFTGLIYSPQRYVRFEVSLGGMRPNVKGGGTSYSPG